MPTMNEIAKYCGKSVTTVSHVLRDGPHAKRYSAATRQQVLEAAAELEYVPNFFAAQIQKQNRRAIMIGFGHLNDPYAAAIAAAFEGAAAERGYYLFTTTLGSKREQPLHETALGESAIQAFAVVGYTSRLVMPDSVLSKYARNGVHVMTIGRPVSDAQISQVDYDNLRGAERSIDHLVDRGARRIWVVGCAPGEPGYWDVSSIRALHARTYCQASYSSVELRLIRTAGSDSQQQVAALQEALAAAEAPPHGLFCTSDTSALIAIQALSRSGLTVGRDVAVIGYNDEPYASLLSPSLTTVRIPMTELGRRGADMLIDQYEGRESPGARLTLETELMIRESSNLSHCTGEESTR